MRPRFSHSRADLQPAAYRKYRARIGGNGRGNARLQAPITPSRFDLVPNLAPRQYRVGERNTTAPGGLYWCGGCRRRATYLVRQRRTSPHSWLCQDCTDRQRGY